MASEAKEWYKIYDEMKVDLRNRRVNSEFVKPAELLLYARKFKDLNTRLNELEKSPKVYGLDDAEIARRKVLLKNLKSTYDVVKSVQTISNNYKSSNPLSEQSLIQRQHDLIHFQDDMLDEISNGVERIHNQAVLINEEAKSSVRLLDAFEGDVEMATAALQNESKHVDSIKEHTRMCYLYICISIEVLVLTLLLVIAYSR